MAAVDTGSRTAPQARVGVAGGVAAGKVKSLYRLKAHPDRDHTELFPRTDLTLLYMQVALLEEVVPFQFHSLSEIQSVIGKKWGFFSE